MIATCRVGEGNSPLCGAAEKQMTVLGLVFSSVSKAHLGWWGFVGLLAVSLYYWDLDEMNLTPSSKRFMTFTSLITTQSWSQKKHAVKLCFKQTLFVLVGEKVHLDFVIRYISLHNMPLFVTNTLIYLFHMTGVSKINLILNHPHILKTFSSSGGFFNFFMFLHWSDRKASWETEAENMRQRSMDQDLSRTKGSINESCALPLWHHHCVHNKIK